MRCCMGDAFDLTSWSRVTPMFSVGGVRCCLCYGWFVTGAANVMRLNQMFLNNGQTTYQSIPQNTEHIPLNTVKYRKHYYSNTTPENEILKNTTPIPLKHHFKKKPQRKTQYYNIPTHTTPIPHQCPYASMKVLCRVLNACVLTSWSRVTLV